MQANIEDDLNRVDLAQVPIIALRQRGRTILSRSLNPCKVLPSEEGYPRDWRGIAHLAGLQSLYGPSINAESDQMNNVLAMWYNRGENRAATLQNLVKFLGLIDRWDVADDISEALMEDAQAFETRRYQRQMQDARQDAAELFNDVEVGIEVNKPDTNILTKDDVIRARNGLPPQQYDAFVLFADEDIDFAGELVERMEEDHPRFGFKLCLKDRDLVGGISFEHEAIMRLIAERCNRLIVIVSPEFLKSPANKFFVNFATALQIEQRYRKIIPCLYKNCVLPPSLSFYFLLKYQQSGKLFNFWDKLSDSTRSTNGGPNGPAVRAIAPPSIQITEITDSSIQPASTPAVQAATPSQNTISVPVKSPRKKGSKVPVPDQMKVHTKPEPKIRSAFSMVQLNDAQTANEALTNNTASTPVNCDINRSETNLSQMSTTKSSRSKSKWYKKLLSSNNANTKTNPSLTVTTATKSCESITKPKSKRSWLRKRLTSSAT